MSESTDIMELLGRRCCHVIAAVAGLALIASSERVWSGAFVYDSGAYFSAAGDVDGDGLEDVIILDKASGACRVGLGRVDGGFGFGDPMASGVPNVEGLAVGKLIEVGRDAVAVSGFAANRVHVLSPVDTLFNELGNVAAAGSVPGPLAALDVPSSGTAGLDDLVVYSFGRAETQVLKNLAGSFTEIGSFSSGGEVRDTNPVLLSAGGAQHLGYFPVGGSTKYRIAKSVSGAVIPWFDSVELPDGSLAIWVGTRDFPESEFLFFAPGGSAVTVQRINSGEDGFLAPRGFDLGADISQMYRLPGLSGDRVLVQFGDGVLEVFDFGSATGFESAGVIDGGTVDRATGVVPLSDGRIVSIFGDADDGAFQVFEREGDGYVASGGVNDLPAAFVHGFSGNLFYFDGVPLLDEAPALLGQRRVADWTVAITGGGAGGVTVVGESFLGVESGLGGEGAVATGQPAPGTVGILVNQVRSDISVASLPTTPAVLGDGTVGLRISPPGGRYDVSIEVVIAPVVAGDKVFLRRDGVGAFVEPVGPLPLFTDGWIEAYAESLDGERRTAVQRVDYHFRTQPEEQDADGDGVPDFVEVAKGTPVSGGGDSDGDGTGDLEELLAGNDPADPDDHPDLESDPRRETAARLVARLTPRPWNASLGAASFARRSTAVRGYSVEGGLLGVGAVEFDGSSFEASLILEPLDVRQRFFSVATEPHFDITAAPVGPVIGRELVALLGVPEIQPIDILYAFDAGGDLQGEASDWVEAAVTAYGETAPSEVVREITVVDTLVLALVEAKLRQVLNVRGTVPPEQTVSLLPYRSPEFDPSLYRHLDNTDLDALATVTKDELASGWEAVRIRALLAVCEEWAVSAEGLPLRVFVEDLYQISGEHNNELPAGLPLPLDALRDFVQRSAFPAAYAPHTGLTGGELVAAVSARDRFFGIATRRPVVTLDVEAGGGSLAEGSRTLVVASGGSIVSLVDGRGGAFEMPEAFDFLSGSQLRVTGFDDLTGPAGTRVIEVISAEAKMLAQAGERDRDGNLLGDSWELFFFGRTGLDAGSSTDGSGFSLLHQFLAGTDPTDGSSVPPGDPVEFDLATADLVIGEEGEGVFSWDWPAEFIDEFEFGIWLASDLSGSDASEEVLSVEGGEAGEENRFAALMNPGGGDLARRRFFRLFVRLR